MTELTLLLIGILAAYRITRLIIEDEVLDAPRNAVFERIKPNGYLYTLLTCYWCLGFWVSILVVGLIWLFPTVAPWVLAPFALSAAVGLIDQKAR